MKRKLSPARLPLPKFKSDEEAAEYFERHSVAGIWDHLSEVQPPRLKLALRKKIYERHHRAKAPISLRLEPEQIVAAKQIAASKSVGYQAQLRMWTAEGIRREARAR